MTWVHEMSSAGEYLVKMNVQVVDSNCYSTVYVASINHE